MERWFLIRNISEGTQKTYRVAMDSYCELLNKTPTELKAEAEAEELAPIRLSDRKVSLNLLKFKKMLQDENKAPKTLNLYFYAIKSFYRAFDIIIPNIKLDSGDIGLEKNIGKLLTREQLRQLISVASPREKALIYLMALSGMGQQEARDLTIKKLIESASQATGIGLETLEDLFKHEEQVLKEVLTLDLTRKKIRYRHQTFVPPEATREIIAYLKERCYGRNEKIRVKDEANEKIFVNNYGGKLSRDSIVTNFRRIGQEAGLKKEKGSYAFWRSHALRKYFISTLINKGVDKVIADYMAGHKIPSQDRTYWMSNPEDLKSHYLKALPYLSIDEAKVRHYDTEEYRELNKKLDEKANEIQELRDEFKSIILLDMQMDMIQKKVRKIENINGPKSEIQKLKSEKESLEIEKIKKLDGTSTLPRLSDPEVRKKFLSMVDLKEYTITEGDLGYEYGYLDGYEGISAKNFDGSYGEGYNKGYKKGVNDKKNGLEPEWESLSASEYKRLTPVEIYYDGSTFRRD